MRSRSLLVVALAALALPAVAMAVSSAHAGMSPVVSAKLLGKNEVPKASPTGSGIAVVHLDGAKGTVCWTFTKVAKIGKPTAAHIHKAAAGKSGPVVVPFGATYKAKGCTKAKASLIGAIEEHPSAYYVNVHTAKYPNGAIRGNLVAGMHG
jgi:hypothetical protein